MTWIVVDQALFLGDAVEFWRFLQLLMPPAASAGLLAGMLPPNGALLEAAKDVVLG
jgi:hypothetical protein